MTRKTREGSPPPQERLRRGLERHRAPERGVRGRLVVRGHVARNPRDVGARPREAHRQGRGEVLVRGLAGDPGPGDEGAAFPRRRPDGGQHGLYLKKCATFLGVGLHLYAERPILPAAPGSPIRTPNMAGLRPPPGRSAGPATGRRRATRDRRRDAERVGHSSGRAGAAARRPGHAPPARRDLEGCPGQGARARGGGGDERPRLQPEARRHRICCDGSAHSYRSGANRATNARPRLAGIFTISFSLSSSMTVPARGGPRRATERRCRRRPWQRPPPPWPHGTGR